MTARQTLDRILKTETTSETIQRAWMGAMMTRFHAQRASTYGVRFDREAQVLRITNTIFVGTPEFDTLGKAQNGVAIDDWGLNPEAVAAFNIASVYQVVDMPPPLADYFWRPFGIHSALTVNGMEDGLFTGNFNVFRTEGHPAFTEAHAADRKWAQQTLRMLSITNNMASAGVIGMRTVTVYRADGSRWLGDGAVAAETWLDEAVQRAMVAFVASGDQEATAYARHIAIHFTALSGGGDQAVLVVTSPMVRFAVPAFTQLTKARRVIASYASLGFTVPEIASAISRSPETVRSQLKAVYTALGIGTRAELATAYATALKPEIID